MTKYWLPAHWKKKFGKKTKLGIGNRKQWSEGIQDITSSVLKLGTLALILLLFIMLMRSVRTQGYIIESFQVPQLLEESGYTGVVVARKLQDEIIELKQLANTVKSDSLFLQGNQSPELEVAVLGFGFSLKSVSYHLRELFGQKNYVLYGEITRLDSAFSLTLRMTDYPPVERRIAIENGQERDAIQKLIRVGGETVLYNLDPYRLALVCRKEDRLADGIAAVRRILETRPEETHWAYLAWGSILEDKGEPQAAAKKYERAVDIRPDFSLAKVRLAWIYAGQKEYQKAIEIMEEAVASEPNNLERIHNLAWMHHSFRRFPSADSLFERGTQIAPDDYEAWRAWADSKLSRGDIDGALELVERAEAIVGENMEGFLVKAMAGMARKDTSETFANLVAAQELDPLHLLPNRLIIQHNFEFGRYAEVVKQYENISWDEIKISNFDHQRILNLVAMSQNFLGNYEAARARVDASIALEPDMGYPYSTLAETFAFTGQLDSFYHYLELSFQKGMSTSSISTDDEPYDRFKNDPRYQKLIADYRREFPLQG